MSIDLERRVLGALVDGHGDLADYSAEDFPVASHAAIFAVLGTFEGERDWGTVWGRLDLSGHPRALWVDEMRRLMDEACMPSSLPGLTESLREAHRRADIRRTAIALSGTVESPWDDQVVGSNITRLASLTSTVQSRDPRSVRDGMEEVFLREDRVPLPTGLSSLSRLRIRAGDLAVIAARPGVGKSAMLATLSLAAARAGWSVLLLSLEMPTLQIRQRLIASDADIPLEAVEDLSAHGLSAAASSVASLPLWLEDESRSRLDLEAISAMTRRFAQRERAVLVLDYLQLVTSRQRFDRRYELIGHVCRELKHLALSCRIPVVSAAQLSRNAEQRQGKPQLADLRESGDIEQTADSVVLIHRDGEQAWLRVAKQRQGETFTADARYLGSRTRFDDHATLP